MSIEKVLYQAHATATGGRDGRAQSDDGRVDVALSVPRELGGAGGPGTNPEQLFAAGYSACFLGAMKFVGARDKLPVPADTTVQGTVGIGAIPTGFGIEVELRITLPGVDREVAQVVIARTNLNPGVRDTDERLLEVGVGKTDGLQHGARRRPSWLGRGQRVRTKTHDGCPFQRQ